MIVTEKQLRIAAIVFVASLSICWLLALFGPRIIASPEAAISMPQWMFWTTLFFGVMAAVTVPFAWRWLKWRRAIRTQLKANGPEA